MLTCIYFWVTKTQGVWLSQLAKNYFVWGNWLWQEVHTTPLISSNAECRKETARQRYGNFWQIWVAHYIILANKWLFERRRVQPAWEPIVTPVVVQRRPNFRASRSTTMDTSTRLLLQANIRHVWAISFYILSSVKTHRSFPNRMALRDTSCPSRFSFFEKEIQLQNVWLSRLTNDTTSCTTDLCVKWIWIPFFFRQSKLLRCGIECFVFSLKWNN